VVVEVEHRQTRQLRLKALRRIENDEFLPLSEIEFSNIPAMDSHVIPAAEIICKSAAEACLKVEAITQFGGDHARIVEVEAPDGDGVIEQDAVVGDVDDRGEELPALANGVASGEVESSVDGEIGAIVGAFMGAGEAVGKAGAVVNIC
jgi:hypothetical protein